MSQQHGDAIRALSDLLTDAINNENDIERTVGDRDPRYEPENMPTEEHQGFVKRRIQLRRSIDECGERAFQAAIQAGADLAEAEARVGAVCSLCARIIEWGSSVRRRTSGEALGGDMGGFLPVALEAQTRLLVLASWATAKPDSTPPYADPPAVSTSEQTSPIARAIALQIEHEDWTVGQIALAAGTSRATLYRDDTFKAARAALRTGRGTLPRGSKDRDGNLEASDED